MNSWLLYRCDCESMGIPREKQKDLFTFRASVAQALCMDGKDLMRKKRGWPSLDVDRRLDLKKTSRSSQGHSTAGSLLRCCGPLASGGKWASTLQTVRDCVQIYNV